MYTKLDIENLWQQFDKDAREQQLWYYPQLPADAPPTRLHRGQRTRHWRSLSRLLMVLLTAGGQEKHPF